METTNNTSRADVELLAAADAFRELFFVDAEPTGLTLDIDPNDLANGYDRLSKAIANARGRH